MPAFARGAIFGCIALAVVVQAYRPARDNPPIVATRTLEAAVAVPAGVEQILARSCNDCHTDQTRWPWYSNVAPISWIIADHVTDGRRHLNFSEWLRPDVEDPAEYARQKFVSVCRELKIGRMPLLSYEVLHPEARLSTTQIQTICDWNGGGTGESGR
jgi:Haem-binding domain